MTAITTAIRAKARSERKTSVLTYVVATIAIVAPVLGRWLARTTTRARRAVLHLGGFGAIGYGAWLIWPAAGFIVGGLLLVVLDYLATPANEVT